MDAELSANTISNVGPARFVESVRALQDLLRLDYVWTVNRDGATMIPMSPGIKPTFVSNGYEVTITFDDETGQYAEGRGETFDQAVNQALRRLRALEASR